MAYKFQLGAAILSGSLIQEGTVEIKNDAGTIVGVFDNAGFLSGASGVEGASFTADGAVTAGSLVVGSANMSETDLEKLDDITNGSGAANKALVLDANSAITQGLVSLTASSGILCGELVANGHLRAPALISTNLISGSGQGSFNSLQVGGGTATVSELGAAVFASVAGTSVSGSGQGSFNSLQVGGGLATVSELGAAVFTTVAGTDISGSGDGRFLALDINGIERISSAGNVTAVGLSGSGNLQVGGTVQLDGVADIAVAVASDSFYFLDADSGLMRRDTIADLVAGIAGSGLTASAGVLSTQAGTVTQIVAATTALVEGYNYYTGSDNKSLTLPASPTVGDVVYLKAQALGAGNAVTVNRAGSHTIDGQTSVLLESDYGAIGFVYLVANNWGII